MSKNFEIGPSLKSYNQIIINIVQFNRDCTPHVANKLFSLIRQGLGAL